VRPLASAFSKARSFSTAHRGCVFCEEVALSCVLRATVVIQQRERRVWTPAERERDVYRYRQREKEADIYTKGP